MRIRLYAPAARSRIGPISAPHAVQAIAGHSHIGVTMTIYAHSALDDQTRALKGLGEALGGAG